MLPKAAERLPLPDAGRFRDRLRKKDGMGRKPSCSLKWIVSIRRSPF